MITSAVRPVTRDQIEPHRGPPDELRDAMRSLLRRLLGRGQDSQPPLRTIGLTGCCGGEGVSTLAAHLALEAALTSGHEILLIDANRAPSSIHRLLGTQTGPGLSDALRDGTPLTEFLQTSATSPRLCVLTAGQDETALASFDESASLSGLFESLKSEFNLIIVDLPPEPDERLAGALAGLLDGLLLVAEAERTRVETLRQGKDRWENRARVLGVLLNKRPQHVPAWLDRVFGLGGAGAR